MDCALKLVSVAFLACGSFLPTLSLARLKSMPTPGFFLRFLGIVFTTMYDQMHVLTLCAMKEQQK